LPGLLPVFFFLLFPAFAGFTSTLFQIASGYGSSLLSVLGDFVSSLANFERRGIPVPFLSFALGLSLLLARVRTSAGQDDE
jgi:hypothetical protein